MKRFLLLICLAVLAVLAVFAVLAADPEPGVGIVVGDKIVPGSDTYYASSDRFHYGGWHSVSNTAARTNLVSYVRKAGMAVYQTDTDKFYILGADLTTWTEFMECCHTFGTNTVDVTLANGTSADFAVTNFSKTIPHWGRFWTYLTATGGHPHVVNTQWKFYREDSRTDSLEYVTDADIKLVELALSVASAAGTNVVYVADATDFTTNGYIVVHNAAMTTNETHLVTSFGTTNLVIDGTLDNTWTAGFVSSVLWHDMPLFPISSSNSLLGTLVYPDSTNQFDLRIIAEYK